MQYCTCADFCIRIKYCRRIVIGSLHSSGALSDSIHKQSSCFSHMHLQSLHVKFLIFLIVRACTCPSLTPTGPGLAWLSVLSKHPKTNTASLSVMLAWHHQSRPGWVLCKLYRFKSLNARACANLMGTGLRAGGYIFKWKKKKEKTIRRLHGSSVLKMGFLALRCETI